MFRLVISLLALALSSLHAQKKPKQQLPYSNDFQEAESGSLPEGIMEIYGVFKVEKEGDDQKYLVMSKEPLSENAVLLGPSLRGGATVGAKIRSFKKRRSYPRFAIGLHGISGFRLRVVPSKGLIEFVKNEESVKTVPFKWHPDEWIILELSVLPKGEDWLIEGRAWSASSSRPVKAIIKLIHKGSPGQGKASLWGTAYSGRAVHFDDVRITSLPPHK